MGIDGVCESFHLEFNVFEKVVWFVLIKEKFLSLGLIHVLSHLFVIRSVN